MEEYLSEWKGKMKKFFVILIFCFMISGCVTRPETINPSLIQTAIEQTVIAQPSFTPLPSSTFSPTLELTVAPTPNQLTDLYLASILILPGDLSSDYSAGEIRIKEPLSKSIPKPINNVLQQVNHNNDVAGVVSILVYDNQVDALMAYKHFKGGYKQIPEVPHLGEQSGIVDNGLTLDLFFIRCYTVGNIQVQYPIDKNSFISYAYQLDERLSHLVCQ